MTAYTSCGLLELTGGVRVLDECPSLACRSSPHIVHTALRTESPLGAVCYKYKCDHLDVEGLCDIGGMSKSLLLLRLQDNTSSTPLELFARLTPVSYVLSDLVVEGKRRYSEG